MATRKEATEFIRAKAFELATYMETQGYGYEVTGSVLLGLAAGWIARARGKEVAYTSLDMARSAIEQHNETRQ